MYYTELDWPDREVTGTTLKEYAGRESLLPFFSEVEWAHRARMGDD